MPPTHDSDAGATPPRRPRRPRPPSPERSAKAGSPPSGGSDAEPPQYTRYRAGRQLPKRPKEDGDERKGALRLPRGPGGGPGPGLATPGSAARWRRALGRRVLPGLIALATAWIALSLVLFLVSAQFNRTAPPSNVKSVLDPAGYPLTSTNNILVLGSDQRQKHSKEPGADVSGPSRSDTIMLIRTGGGHSARLSIPRDTVVNIPGHGLQKINAAYAFGGAALSISVIKRYLGVPINHLVEVNFENFPQLIDSMGGVDYTGGCIVSRLDGGFREGGFTLRLPRGTHHIDGKQALALARTRENLCAPRETDIQREEHQQALFQDMKSRLLSPSSFLRAPLIAWNAPPAIISDMSGPSLLGLFGALALNGTPPTRVLRPSGSVTLAEGGEGLSVSEAERRAAVARFMAG
jgi:LCP family protein required for cell wall assembly